MRHPIEGKTVCPAPWSSLMIKPNGSVTPDPHFQGEWGNIERQTLKQILESPVAAQTRSDWQQAGWPQACRVCETKTRTLGHSRRGFFEDMLRTFGESVAQDRFRLRFLDVATSNLCNLACVMCSGRLSTSWLPLEKKFAAAGFTEDRPTPEQAQVWKLSERAFENIFADPELLSSLFYLSLKGGEPFLDPNNDVLLTRLLEIIPPGQLVLDVTTNGTTVSPALLNGIHRFRALKLLFSTEGLGPTYSLMRGGERFAFAQFEQNLKMLAEQKHVEIYVVFLLTALNIHELRPLLKWFQSLNLPNISLNLKNILVNPHYLSPNVLPESVKARELEALRKEGWDTFVDTPRLMGLNHVFRALQSAHPGGPEGQAKSFDLLQTFMTTFTAGRPQLQTTWSEWNAELYR